MEILDFAEKILYAESIEDKLFSPESFSLEKKIYKGKLPSLPSRPPEISISSSKKRTAFPKFSELDQDEKRGHVLHFFANHELLAMELMALCLLKLKDVPESFLTGIAHTIKEEQVHMRLYIERMKELGVNFGDIALNDFFWNALKDIESISDYVSGMSMTFEQANLDFSVQYHRAMLELGDKKTASILKTVYDDEIGHVSFGLDWFEKLRPKKHDLFTEYKNSLKLPIDPHRGKAEPISML